MALVTARYESIQYDGTNVEDLLAFLEGAVYEVVEVSPEVLVMTDGEGTTKTIPVNGWVIRSFYHELVWQGSDAAYQKQWTVVS